MPPFSPKNLKRSLVSYSDDEVDYSEEEFTLPSIAESESERSSIENAQKTRENDLQEVPAGKDGFQVVKEPSMNSFTEELITRMKSDTSLRTLLLNLLHSDEAAEKNKQSKYSKERIPSAEEFSLKNDPKKQRADDLLPQFLKKGQFDLEVKSSSGFKINQVDTYDGLDPELAMEYISKMNLFLKLIHEKHDTAKIGHFGMILSGIAWEWFQTFLTSEEFDTSDYNELQRQFINLFGTQLQMHTARRNWHQCKQGKQPPERYVITYRNALTRYVLLASSDQKPSNFEICTRFIKGLNANYRQMLEQKLTLGAATKIQDVIETLLLESASVANFREIVDSEESKRKVSLEEYEEFRKKNPVTPPRKKHKKGKTPYAPVVCNNCNTHGHTAANCPRRSPFEPNSKDPVVCSHCNKTGHEEDKCWIKNPELRPKKKVKFDKQGGKSKMAMIKTSQKLPGIVLEGRINNSKKCSTFQLDSGCDISQLTFAFCAEYGIEYHPTDSQVEFGNFGTQNVFVSEEVTLSIENHFIRHQSIINHQSF
jgi:hypothetical protein